MRTYIFCYLVARICISLNSHLAGNVPVPVPQRIELNVYWCFCFRLLAVVHGSAASLVSGGSSMYGSTDERQAIEVRRLKRELGDAREQVHSLSSQLSTNVSTLHTLDPNFVSQLLAHFHSAFLSYSSNDKITNERCPWQRSIFHCQKIISNHGPSIMLNNSIYSMG